MLELYLIRHPKTLGGVDLIKGHNDVGLERGWENRVDALAAELAKQVPFDAFFSSDLERARLPAKRIVEYLRERQEKPLELIATELLRERDLGVLQGKRYGEVDTGGKNPVDYIFEVEVIPGGESKSDAIGRAKRFVEEYLQKYINERGRVGIVGHGWMINYLINVLLGDHSRLYNGMKNLEMVHLSVEGPNHQSK